MNVLGGGGGFVAAQEPDEKCLSIFNQLVIQTICLRFPLQREVFLLSVTKCMLMWDLVNFYDMYSRPFRKVKSSNLLPLVLNLCGKCNQVKYIGWHCLNVIKLYFS